MFVFVCLCVCVFVCLCVCVFVCLCGGELVMCRWCVGDVLVMCWWCVGVLVWCVRVCFCVSWWSLRWLGERVLIPHHIITLMFVVLQPDAPAAQPAPAAPCKSVPGVKKSTIKFFAPQSAVKPTVSLQSIEKKNAYISFVLPVIQCSQPPVDDDGFTLVGPSTSTTTNFVW